jgi:hypothetical protein
MSGICSKDFQPESDNCRFRNWESSNIPHSLFLKANFYIITLLILNPSSCTVALGWTQPLTEISTRNLPGGKGRPVHKPDNLTFICYLIVYKIWDPWHITKLWTPPPPQITILFLFLFSKKKRRLMLSPCCLFMKARIVEPCVSVCLSPLSLLGNN